jgi:hypothetical protein
MIVSSSCILAHSIPKTWLCACLSLPRQPGQWSRGEFYIHLTLPHGPSGTPFRICEMSYMRGTLAQAHVNTQKTRGRG